MQIIIKKTEKNALITNKIITDLFGLFSVLHLCLAVEMSCLKFS